MTSASYKPSAMRAVPQTVERLSAERHKGLRWRPAPDFEFAAHWFAVPLAFGEVLRAAAYFPVVFRAETRGIGPVALLSSREGNRTPFLNPDGRLRSGYVPELLRLYPFCVHIDGAGEAALAFDPSPRCVGTDPEWRAVFEPSGTLSSEVARITGLLKGWTADHQRALLVTQALKGAGVLRPVSSQAQQVAACFQVDAHVLEAKDNPEQFQLLRSGALQLAYAHAVSLAHLVKLNAPVDDLARAELGGQTMLASVRDSIQRDGVWNDLF